MFCKWCGGNIASSDTKCKRCGKEVPALSDCGGFYDLVPSAKKPSNAQPEPVAPPVKPASPPRKPEPVREVEPARAKKNSKKPFLGLALLNVVGFLLVIAMLLIVLSKVNQYSTEVNGLRNDLRTISEKIDSLAEATEPVTTEPEAMEPETTEPEAMEPETTEPTIALDPVLAEQNIIFTAKINSKESALELDADLDLGSYTDTAVISYSMDEDTNYINSISYSLKEAGTTVVITVECNDEFRTKNLSVSYVIDDIAYGLSNAPETCKWQYRFDSNAEWEDLPETFTQTSGVGKTGLSIREAALQELIADNEGELELRCEISRSNTKNGSLTFVIEGIRFYEEANSEEYSVG